MNELFYEVVFNGYLFIRRVCSPTKVENNFKILWKFIMLEQPIPNYSCHLKYRVQFTVRQRSPGF